MAYEFGYLIETLESWGVADVLLPFILVFTIVFAVLQRTEILGAGKKNFNVVIALVVSLSVVIPHVLGNYPSGYDVVDIINTVLPQVSLVAIAFLMVLILAGLVGGKIIGESIGGFLVLISLIAIVLIFGGSLGWWESNWFYNFFGEETVALVIMILVFGLIIWFITREAKTPGKKITDFVKDIGNFFVGK